jgi:hypothetical protein
MLRRFPSLLLAKYDEGERRMVMVKCKISKNQNGWVIEERRYGVLNLYNRLMPDYIIGHCECEVGMDRVLNFWGQRGDSSL